MSKPLHVLYRTVEFKTLKIMADYQNSLVHYTTQAEAAIMAAIDQVVNNTGKEDQLVRIDFDFLRDYAVQKLQSRLMNLDYRNYTEKACWCVGASRYYYRDRHISQLKYTQKV